MDEKRMGLVDHLSELRRMIVWIVIALVVGFALGFWKVEMVQGWMISAIPSEKLAFYAPAEAFAVQIKIAFFTAIILAFPVICASLAWFVFPGLTQKERVWMPILLLAGIALFFIGCLVVLFAALPSVLKFLNYVTPDNMEPMISFSKYFAFAMSMTVAGGITMLIPYAILILIVMGIVTAEAVAKKRWVFITSIISLGLIIGYSLDLMTMLILFVPAYLLFELALFLGGKWRRYIERNNNVGGEVQ